MLNNNKINPRDLKRHLAREIITIYHDKAQAKDAETEFDNIFIHSEIPNNIDTWKINDDKNNILTILNDSGLVSSKKEARRMINQGAVSIDGEKIHDINFNIEDNKELILKVGKRKFLKIVS